VTRNTVTGNASTEQVELPTIFENGFWHHYAGPMKTTRALESGDRVKVTAWGGTVLTRRVVSIRGDTVAVCSEEEYQAAKKENRKASAIGFKIEKVVLVEP
jgi:hypothetical protein